jgi:hypothetical protein
MASPRNLPIAGKTIRGAINCLTYHEARNIG